IPRPKIWRADEAQERDAERDAKSCDQYQVVAKYQLRKRRHKPERSTALLPLIAAGLVATIRGHRIRPPTPRPRPRQNSHQTRTPAWGNRAWEKMDHGCG